MGNNYATILEPIHTKDWEKDKTHSPGVAGYTNNDCFYCWLGRKVGWKYFNVFHTHDFDNALQHQATVDIDPLTYLGNDVMVNAEEIEAANMSIHNFFEGTGIDPKARLAFDLVIILAKLNKFRIQKPFNISEETEKMINLAKIGNFDGAFKILDKTPVIVNYIPPDRAWGLLHQAAYFNNYSAVRKILTNPKCDPLLRTKQSKDGSISLTAYDIAKRGDVKDAIKQLQDIRRELLKDSYIPTLVSVESEVDIEVDSIILVLNCFESVLHPQTLDSKRSLIYSNLMFDIFHFINAGNNWKRARREVSLQLQSIDIYAATFLATGRSQGNIMDEAYETKDEFYSRVIHLYTQQCSIKLLYDENGKSTFYSALNRSLRRHGCNSSFVSGEDLALAAYGVLLNSIIMYWAVISPTRALTYRKMDIPFDDIHSYKLGQTFTWLCFTSTSADKSKADKFEGNCMLIFDNSQTSKYAAKGIRKHSNYRSEDEYLYPSGVRFRIIGKDQTPNLTMFRMVLEDY